MNDASNTSQPDEDDLCRRCGKCCLKGGPSLHLEDRPLIKEGRIPLNALFTIRAHEPVYDNIRNRTDTALTDIIKIKGTGRQWACLFYDKESNGCTIYEDRPLECRILTCWDTRKIEAVYNKDRLTRKDLIGHIQGLWELVMDHHKRCDYSMITELAKNDRQPVSTSRLNEIMQYDIHLRKQILQKGLATPDMIDFLLGRPLPKTLAPLGIRQKPSG